jgi:hypothetical protein
MEQAQEMIEYAVQCGDLNGDSDANEIRQVLASFPVEVREHFVVDLGRSL